MHQASDSLGFRCLAGKSKKSDVSLWSSVPSTHRLAICANEITKDWVIIASCNDFAAASGYQP
jgi:hypothetical protein